MATFLCSCTYTSESMRSMVQQPQDREVAVRKMLHACQMTLQSIYFELPSRVHLIIEGSNASKNAFAMAIASSGALVPETWQGTEVVSSQEFTETMKRAHEVTGSDKSPVH